MRSRILVLCLAGVVATGCLPLAPQDTAPAATLTDAPTPSADAVTGVVERVVDGDTVIIELDGERERVRLLRIDTPELGEDGGEPECQAEAARLALEALLPAGAEVRLEQDVEPRDRFGRLLAHVWVDDTWVNGTMLRQGWANVVTFPPNVAHDVAVREAQREAVEDEVGLWQPGVC